MRWRYATFRWHPGRGAERRSRSSGRAAAHRRAVMRAEVSVPKRKTPLGLEPALARLARRRWFALRRHRALETRDDGQPVSVRGMSTAPCSPGAGAGRSARDVLRWRHNKRLQLTVRVLVTCGHRSRRPSVLRAGIAASQRAAAGVWSVHGGRQLSREPLCAQKRVFRRGRLRLASEPALARVVCRRWFALRRHRALETRDDGRPLSVRSMSTAPCSPGAGAGRSVRACSAGAITSGCS